MNTAIEITATNELSLDDLLSALDPQSSDVVEDKKIKSEPIVIDAMSELDKLAAELNTLDSLDLSAEPTKDDNSVLVVAPNNVVDEDLGSVLSQLSEQFEDEKPNIEAIKPAEVIEVEEETSAKIETVEAAKPVSEEAPKPKKATSTEPKTHLDINALTKSDCEKLGVDKSVLLANYELCPKKAKEKVLNIIQWALKGVELSIYTQLCFECLINNNTATSEMMRINMMSNPTRPYPSATAGTQAGQLMATFPAMKIADRVGKNITIIPTSPLVELFKKHYAK
ncbi:hypothetical protein [Providencia sp. MGF014]|uniref:hypothetical protein n=1 Tax=Providencia sp. MGF014 TaxID=2565573 RepID=UPI00109CB5AA|nr:hypothetical protein [Providencia sp. MGF014]THB27359.1 hypothetical protein E6R27_08950 [Providencia sp. MGF014]